MSKCIDHGSLTAHRVQRGFGVLRGAQAHLGKLPATQRVRVGHYAGVPLAILSVKDAGRRNDAAIARYLGDSFVVTTPAHPASVFDAVEERIKLTAVSAPSESSVSVLPRSTKAKPWPNDNPMHAYARALQYLYRDCFGLWQDRAALGGFMRLDGRYVELGHDLQNFFYGLHSESALHAMIRGYLPVDAATRDFFKYRYRVYCAEHLVDVDERVLQKLDELHHAANEYFNLCWKKDPSSDARISIIHTRFGNDSLINRVKMVCNVPTPEEIHHYSLQKIYEDYFGILSAIDDFLAERKQYASAVKLVSKELRSRASQAQGPGGKYLTLHFTVLIQLQALLDHLEQDLGSSSHQSRGTDLIAPHIPFTRLDVVMLRKLVERLQNQHDLMMARLVLKVIPKEFREASGNCIMQVLLSQWKPKEDQDPDGAYMLNYADVVSMFRENGAPEGLLKAVRILAGAKSDEDDVAHPLDPRQLSWLMAFLVQHKFLGEMPSRM